MHIDRELVQEDGAALTVTRVSADVLDLLVSQDISRGGYQFRARAQVRTAFTAGGAGTLVVELIQSAAADLSAPDVLASANGGAPIALAGLTAGAILLDTPLPRTSKRYLGWRFTVATGPMTAGAIDAFLVDTTETPTADRKLGNTGL